MTLNSVFLNIAKQSKNPDGAFAFCKFMVSEAGQKILYKLRTEMPVLKPILKSPNFINSRGYASFDKMFVHELYKTEIPKSRIKGFMEWNYKIVKDKLELYENGLISTHALIKVLNSTYKRDVADNL